MKKILLLMIVLVCLSSCAKKAGEGPEPQKTAVTTSELEQDQEPFEEKTFNFDLSYIYEGSRDPIKPSINLDVNNGMYSFVYSGFSSNIPIGEYELTEDRLYLWTDEDKTLAYTFEVTDEGYVFIAQDSPGIPTYKVSGDSDERYSPVPDGALFKRESSKDYGVTEYGGYVKRLGSDDRIKMSEEDGDAVANIIFGLEWQEGPTDCIFDCQLDINGFLVKYHSSCGALNHMTPSYLSHVDPEEKYSYCILDDEKQQELNDIVVKYITLGSDIVE